MPIITHKNHLFLIQTMSPSAVAAIGVATGRPNIFILEGLFFIGINEQGDPERILEQVGEDTIYVFEDRVLTGNHDIHVWMRGSNNYFYFTNSIIKHAGRTTEGSASQGSFIDTRGNDQELIYIPAPGHYTEDLLRNFTYSDEHQSYTHAENGFPAHANGIGGPDAANEPCQVIRYSRS